MKNNIFKLAFVAMAATALFLSCNKEKDNDSAIQKPVMVTLSADDFFTEAKANVTATLTEAQDHDVVVTLAPATQIAQAYTEPIDVDLVSAGTITIPAGATEGSTTVSVDNSELPKGKYETQLVVTSCKGANMSSDDNVNIILLQGVSTVSIAFDSGYSDEGETTFTVSLDMYSEEDCEVTISQLDFPGYENVPVMAFNFDKTVVIKAGETEATGKAYIDLDCLYDSGFFVGALQIADVSEGKFEIGEKFYTAAGFDFTVPIRNRTWKMEYYGHVAIGGDTREAFLVSGVNGYFDYFITSAETEALNSFIFPNLICEENAYLASGIKAGEKLEDLCYYSSADDDPVGVVAIKRAPGNYKLWILSVDETGVCTGYYSFLEFTVEEEPEPTKAYSAWIGDWILGSTAEEENPIVVTISAKDVNQSYYIDGLEGLDTKQYGLSATAYFEDGTISIYPQTLGTWTHSTYGPATDVLAGLIVEGGKTYYVGSGENPVAYGVIGADGTAVLTPGSWMDSEGTLYGIVGLKYYWVVEAGAGAYSKGMTPLPDTLIPVKPEPNPSSFESKKFNGTFFFHNQAADHSKVGGELTNHIRLK